MASSSLRLPRFQNQLGCKTVIQIDVYVELYLAFLNTTLVAKPARIYAPSESLRRRQGLKEYRSRPRL